MAARLTIALHRVPETEDYAGGYEATTMGGTPRGVVISSTGHASSGEALEDFLAALGELGFSGPVSVEDATYLGGVHRYDAVVPPTSGDS